VVPTTGNRITYLQQCLNSVRRQQEPVEVVIVGPAAAAETLTDLAKKYRCQYVRERVSGMSNAVNQGWEGARTEYLAWLGDDDLLASGSVAAAADALESKPTASMVYGRVQVIDAKGNPVYTMRSGQYASAVLRYGQNFVWQPGSLYRREAVCEAGILDPCLRYAMDFDLHLRLRRLGTLHHLPRLLACYRAHSATLTATNPDPDGELRHVMRRYLGPTARASEKWWWPVAKRAGHAWGYAQHHMGWR
jgi:GT2 family glycosyltransferase